MYSAEPPHSGPVELIASSLHGTIARCPDCGALECRFGNMLLRLDITDLAQVRSKVRSSVPRKAKGVDHRREGRSIDIHVGESGAGFAFSPAEAAELASLLQAAERALSANQLTADLVAELFATPDEVPLIPIPEAVRRRLGASDARS